MDLNARGGHSAAAAAAQSVGSSSSGQPPYSHDMVIFTQSQIEACLLRGMSKWEIVSELHSSSQIKQSMILDVWTRLEEQNRHFFEAYDQFIRLRNVIGDFNDVAYKLSEDSNGAGGNGSQQMSGDNGSGSNNNGGNVMDQMYDQKQYGSSGGGALSGGGGGGHGSRYSPTSAFEPFGRPGSSGGSS